MTRCAILLCFLLIIPVYIHSQASTADQQTIPQGSADLSTCIQYALDHNPLLEQLRIRDKITRKTIASELSGWLPQIELNANYQNYLRQPVSIFPDFSNPDGPKREVTTGVANTSSIQLGASQTIYSPELVIAGTSARLYKRQSFQSNQELLIDLILNLSKAFYNVLVTQERLNLFLEDRSRIDRSFKDAFSLYESGLNDKIDYQRAQISLNNIDAEIAGTREEIKASYALLKELMGYPHTSAIVVQSDSNIAEKAWLDTSLTVRPGDRVEYQL
ncbi:MAG TPA: TolC family protein, partial [Bacteroidales bacterium]|nr:TolC family protein [Bacteroidales bacterium]